MISLGHVCWVYKIRKKEKKYSSVENKQAEQRVDSVYEQRGFAATFSLRRFLTVGPDMYLKVQLPWNVIIPAENLDAKGLMLQRSIVLRLLDEFSSKKSTKDLGYFLAVTTLESIGEGRVRQHSGDVLFPVVFSGITFKIFRGEILEGVVHKVLKHGVILRCGPIENVYLSSQKMHGYNYVPGENPVFMSEKLSKIEKDVVVRVIVIGTKWLEAEREFQALVSLDGDFLGPVS